MPHIRVDSSLAEVLERMLPLLRGSQPEAKPADTVEEIKTVPRYQLKGSYGTKAMRMANVLDELIKSFSDEKNLSQREVIEVALIEFLRKYGYKDEVDRCFIE